MKNLRPIQRDVTGGSVIPPSRSGGGNSNSEDKFDIACRKLSKYILENKERVIEDLKNMRDKSTGENDIYNYIKKISGIDLNDK